MPKSFDLLLRFQLATGSRVAARLVLPPVVALTAVAFFLGPELLENLAIVLFPAVPAPGLQQLVLLLLILALVRQVRPRFDASLSGWQLSLPVPGSHQRWAAAAAATAALAPALLVLAALVLVRPRLTPAPIGWHPLLAVPALVAATWSSALALWATRRSQALWLLVASLLLWTGSALAALPGAVLLGLALLWDQRPGHPTAPPAAPRRRRRAKLASSRNRGPGTSLLWTTRVLGWRRLLSALVLPAIALACGAAFVLNNPLPTTIQTAAARLAGALALTSLLASLSHELSERRPVWAWRRSLPEASAARVRSDISLLLAGGLLVVAPVAALSWSALPPLILISPLLCCRAAANQRRAIQRATAPPAAGLALEGILLSMLTAVWMPSALFAVLLTPWAFRTAVEAEKNLRPTRWSELAGDPGAASLNP